MITFSKLGEAEYGRLGNQLFQIAATIGIADLNNQQFCFPVWGYQNDFKNKLPACRNKIRKIYSTDKAGFLNVKLEDTDTDLQGFFQSEKYFIGSQRKIRNYFTPALEIQAYIDTKYRLVLEKETCSIHVRRGDYLQQKHFFPSPSTEYFNTAISRFSDTVTFIVFSDDIEWCRNQFTGSQFYFVENERDIIDLFIMSRCKNHIISNSSFSWWGAWLNPSETKTIYCPANWVGPAVSLNPDKYAADIYPPYFTKIILEAQGAFFERVQHTFLFFYYKLVIGPIKKTKVSLYKSFKNQHELFRR